MFEIIGSVQSAIIIVTFCIIIFKVVKAVDNEVMNTDKVVKKGSVIQKNTNSFSMPGSSREQFKNIVVQVNSREQISDLDNIKKKEEQKPFHQKNLKFSDKNKKMVNSSVHNKKSNVGLRIPGSNWEKFKNVITENAPSEETPDSIQIKKKQFHENSHQKKRKHIETYQKMENVNKSKETCKLDTELTRIIAMDCEMVGIGNGQDSMIARVSIVNSKGICVYDKYVKPTEEVQDYRTAVSGIRPHHLQGGEDFKIVQKEVAEILKGRILVGHALHNDLSVLFLSHPFRYQRDTSRYKLFRKVTKGNTPSLKKLATELLGVDIQSGEHNSIEDARAALQLYLVFRKKWENDIRKKHSNISL